MAKKIFVTGSESFVGRELIKQCANYDIAVLGVDVSGGNDGYEFRNADIRDPAISGIMPTDADAVVHLAALSRDADCRDNAYQCFDVNVMGTLNVMRAAKMSGIKQFIFASSEWVYDSFENGIEKDEDAAIDISRLTSEYALSKLVSEANLGIQYARGFPAVTILRFGIIYGPRRNNWSAVESLASSVKKQDEVVVGSLRTGRRFVHVSDIAKGIVKSIGRSGFDIINLTGDQIVTLGEVIEASEKIFEKKIKISESDSDSANVRNPSNARAKKLLGWRPEIALEAGLKTLLPFI
ncbi:MAG: NAD(P)-dependent oxidoreductase [Patescibacteria group bacterium]